MAVGTTARGETWPVVLLALVVAVFCQSAIPEVYHGFLHIARNEAFPRDLDFDRAGVLAHNAHIIGKWMIAFLRVPVYYQTPRIVVSPHVKPNISLFILPYHNTCYCIDECVILLVNRRTHTTHARSFR